MSEMQRHSRVRASDQERDYVLHLLQKAHAAGRIDIAELNERQDKVFETKFSDDFVELLEDLPEGQEVVAALRPAPAPRPMRNLPRFLSAPAGADQSLSILSSKKIVAQPGSTSFHLMAFLGGDTLDLTLAMRPGLVMVVESQSVLGGSTIKVPPGVRIVDETQAIMGGNNIKRRAMGDGSNGTLVLRGIAILGGHNVKLA